MLVDKEQENLEKYEEESKKELFAVAYKSFDRIC